MVVGEEEVVRDDLTFASDVQHHCRTFEKLKTRRIAPKFGRLANVTTVASVDVSPPTNLVAIIRAIVREELQRQGGRVDETIPHPPTNSPYYTAAPSAPLPPSRWAAPAQQARHRPFTAERSQHWFGERPLPVCYNCVFEEHIARYCNYRQPPRYDRSPRFNRSGVTRAPTFPGSASYEIPGPLRNQSPASDRSETPPPAPRANRSPSPRRRHGKLAGAAVGVFEALSHYCSGITPVLTCALQRNSTTLLEYMVEFRRQYGDCLKTDFPANPSRSVASPHLIDLPEGFLQVVELYLRECSDECNTGVTVETVQKASVAVQVLSILSRVPLDSTKGKVSPSHLHLEVIPFFYDCLSSKPCFLPASIQMKLIHVFGAIICGAQHNAQVAINQNTVEILFHRLREQECPLEVKMTAVRCILQGIVTLCASPPEKRKVDLNAFVREYLGTLSKLMTEEEKPTQVDTAHWMMSGLQELFSLNSNLALKKVFHDNEMVERLIRSLHGTKLKSGSAQKMATSSVRLIHVFLSSFPFAKKHFSNMQGYRTLISTLKTMGEPQQSTLETLLEWLVEETPRLTRTSSTLRNLELMIHLLHWLPQLESHSLQLWLAEQLDSMVKGSLRSRMACARGGVIPAIIHVLGRSNTIGGKAVAVNPAPVAEKTPTPTKSSERAADSKVSHRSTAFYKTRRGRPRP
ncbi:hypothetical protein HPB51_023256 [Rhipicephalus microplus]|uniref:Uncharacterized protein n=1 Tax=Rhipicephalus microplus TaxID=6941 RepID=A0A9J6F7U5_RHIMP|nr:hypothetical protein HPB51_023256 [Rhipicephalus microplus]